MNAIDFIKQHGIEKAREVVESAPKDAELFHTNTYIKNAHSEGRTDHFARWSDGFNGWVNISADREFIDESIVLEELKRLVESADLINSLGGLGEAKEMSENPTWLPDDSTKQLLELDQAIADYEAIYSIPQSVKRAILNLEMHL